MFLRALYVENLVDWPQNHIFASETLLFASMKHTITKYIFAFACLLGGASGAAAQDLIARQAPVERKVKSADSVVINRVIRNAALHN